MKEKELEAETVREEILRSVRELKEIRPLLHMIPSYVTAALCADAISAAGGRPLMAQAKEEMEEITGSADGLAVNMGQPSEEKFLSCRLALETAAKKGIPVMFDPVGAGASAYRREMMAELLSIPWSGVLKGNSSEIHTLLTGALAHDGVDSIGEFSHEQEAFRYLSREAARGRNLVIAETGKRDRILWLEDSMGNAPELNRYPILILGGFGNRIPDVVIGLGASHDSDRHGLSGLLLWPDKTKVTRDQNDHDDHCPNNCIAFLSSLHNQNSLSFFKKYNVN